MNIKFEGEICLIGILTILRLKDAVIYSGDVSCLIWYYISR